MDAELNSLSNGDIFEGGRGHPKSQSEYQHIIIKWQCILVQMINFMNKFTQIHSRNRSSLINEESLIGHELDSKKLD